MTETQLQIRVVKELRARGFFAIHVPNEGDRTRKEAAIAKQKGVLAGVSDILCLDCMTAIELKLPGEGTTKAQDLFLRALRSLGWTVGVARSVVEAIEIAERGRANAGTCPDCNDDESEEE